MKTVDLPYVSAENKLSSDIDSLEESPSEHSKKSPSLIFDVRSKPSLSTPPPLEAKNEAAATTEIHPPLQPRVSSLYTDDEKVK